MTTFQLASNLHTLSHIRWWRIVVDEPQLGAGGFLQVGARSGRRVALLSWTRWESACAATPPLHPTPTSSPHRGRLPECMLAAAGS